MRRWQLILELLFHYSPTTVSLHLCFPLGHSRKLPLVACHFLLPWFRFAKNKTVLDNVSWQFGPSSFVLGHFFLLGMGLGLDMKWVGVSRFFGPSKPCCLAPQTERRVLMSLGSRHGLSSPVLRECQGLFACPRHAPSISVYKARCH